MRKNRFENKIDVQNLVSDFHEFHNQKRGSQETGQWITCSTWRVKATGKTSNVVFPKKDGTGNDVAATVQKPRKAYFKELGGLVETTVYQESKLVCGQKISAPAIIEQENTTIVVYPGSEVVVSDFGNYIMRLTD